MKLFDLSKEGYLSINAINNISDNGNPYYCKKPKAFDEYECFIMSVNEMLLKLDKNDEKVALLDYAIESLILDLMGSTYTEIFFNALEHKRNDLRHVIPIVKDDLNCVEKEINISDVHVISTPIIDRKLLGAIKDVLQQGFKQELNGFDGFYIEELNLLLIINGRHHAAVAAINKIGKLKVYSFSLEQLFQELDTDGVYWNYLTDDKIKTSSLKKHEVDDIRGPLIFKLAYIKFKLLKNSNEIINLKISESFKAAKAKYLKRLEIQQDMQYNRYRKTKIREWHICFALGAGFSMLIFIAMSLLF